MIGAVAVRLKHLTTLVRPDDVWVANGMIHQSRPTQVHVCSADDLGRFVLITTNHRHVNMTVHDTLDAMAMSVGTQMMAHRPWFPIYMLDLDRGTHLEYRVTVAVGHQEGDEDEDEDESMQNNDDEDDGN